MENATDCPKEGLPGKDPELPESVDGSTNTDPCPREQTTVKGCHEPPPAPRRYVGCLLPTGQADVNFILSQSRGLTGNGMSPHETVLSLRQEGCGVVDSRGPEHGRQGIGDY
jgi:hypothetical protein